MSFLMSYVCSVDNKNSADNESSTKISVSSVYSVDNKNFRITNIQKEEAVFTYNLFSLIIKNPDLIYFCSCKYTNKTDTIQIFPYIFLFLFVKIKLFLPQATKKNPRNTRRTQILVKDFVQDSSYDVEP